MEVLSSEMYKKNSNGKGKMVQPLESVELLPNLLLEQPFND